MLTIGLTGGIASGKSEVARSLSEHGAHIVDADRLVHEVYAPRTPGLAAVAAAFGREVLTPDGSLDRRRLASVVFADSAQMTRLTDIVWPLARGRFQYLKGEEESAGTRLLVLEATLLLQAGWRDLVDELWLVQAPVEAVRERLQARGIADAAERIVSSQPPPEAATEAAVLIDNAGSLSQLQSQVEAAWLTLRERGLV